MEDNENNQQACQVNDVNSVTMSESEDPRENLIATAVNFLQNPKVKDSALSTKRAFLEKKGLTKSEIDLAVERSGVEEHVTQQYQNPTLVERGPVMAYNPHIVPANSTWSKVRDFTAFTIVVGGVGVAVYRLYQHVLKPYLFGVQQKSMEKQVLELQTEMTRTLVKVQESLQAVQDTLKEQEERLQQISIQSGAKKTEESLGRLQDSQFITDIKSEVTSIKGLLLNRRQFPPAPTTTPVLPSWQRSKPSPITFPSPAGDCGDIQSNKMEPGTDEAVQEPGGDSARLNGPMTEPTNGYVNTASVNELVMANKNDGSGYDTSLDGNVEEGDELDPDNQVVVDQSSSQIGDSGFQPSFPAAAKNGVLAQDDTTVTTAS